MLKRLLFLVVALFLVSGVVFSFHGLTPVQAHDPQNVELLYFIGEGVVDGVKLEWRTATEYETAAFRMKRADSASGPFSYIDVWQNGQQVSIIPLQNPGFPETGGLYEVVDMDTLNGQTYWYTLIEVEANGAEIALETIAVVAGLVQSPTPTGQVIGGGGNPSSATATATATATSTQPASPTPVPTTVNTLPAITPTTRANPTGPTSTPPVIPTNPVNTPISGGGGSSGTTGSSTNPTPSGNQPIAQITATSSAAYPGRTEETAALSPETTPETETTYPDAQPTLSPEGNATAYPLGETPLEATVEGAYQGDSTPVITDFSDSGEPGTSDNLPAPVVSNNPATTTNSTRGRIVLWVGFAAGLLIFAAGVFGTILLFTRKQNGPQ
ncbi:MAG: hypothetical protein IPL78_28910 [Chloroflexi bacterium]|nr:hypothetical protein [Chloroflexota bacterium]